MYSTPPFRVEIDNIRIVEEASVTRCIRQGPVCEACRVPMVWRAAKDAGCRTSKRQIDVFECPQCGRTAQVDLEPLALVDHQPPPQTPQR
jgi:hypothetical protein